MWRAPVEVSDYYGKHIGLKTAEINFLYKSASSASSWSWVLGLFTVARSSDQPLVHACLVTFSDCIVQRYVQHITDVQNKVVHHWNDNVQGNKNRCGNASRQHPAFTKHGRRRTRRVDKGYQRHEAETQKNRCSAPWNQNCWPASWSALFLHDWNGGKELERLQQLIPV